MVDSPFQSGGEVVGLPLIDQNKKMVLRVEAGGTFQVNIKKDGNPSSTGADYFLTSGDAVAIPGPCTPSVISITGDPNIYWTLENK